MNTANETGGRPNGWSLDEVTDWLIAEGRLLPSIQDLVGELGRHLVDAGLAVGRVSVFARTLHPQIFVQEAVWYKREDMTRQRPRAHGIRADDDFEGSPVQAMLDTQKPYRHRLTGLEAGRDHGLLVELGQMGLTDYYGQELPFAKAPGGIFIACSEDPNGFASSDLVKLDALARVLAPVVEVLALHAIGTALLDTYLGHRSGQQVMNGQVQRGDGEVIDAALWMSDLRDFTALTEQLPTDQLLEMLNIYFEHVDTAISAQGGEILKFIGDAMLIIFPVDGAGGEEAACSAALKAARDAFASLDAENQTRRDVGKPQIRFGVGLHLGRVIYGNVGARTRMDFTVMGAAVNRTARLESLTKAVGVPLLMSGPFAKAADTEITSHGEHAVKGVPEPMEVFSWAALGADAV